MESCAFFLGLDPIVLAAGMFNDESNLSETGIVPLRLPLFT